MSYFDKARKLLKDFKGDSYNFGRNILSKVGALCSSIGKRAILINTEFPGIYNFINEIKESLQTTGVKIVSKVKGPSPNAPCEDVIRITDEMLKSNPDIIISFGGGSTIDAVKAASILWTLGGKIDDYFGSGLVTEKIKENSKKLINHVAIQTAASSAAHLTKYSNITNLSTGQKKLIVDEAITPQYPMFDYRTTYDAPLALTIDGALDGIAHIIEVLYGAVGKPFYDKIVEITSTGVSLVLKYLPIVIKDSRDSIAREALCLATDLGGYAIMLGGTNGGHLTSFSLIDILSHGRACAIMNPYYTIFFANAIEEPLKLLYRLYMENGFIDSAIKIENLKKHELGIVVVEGMFEFAKSINFPITLGEVNGFNDKHIERALNAAKNPQLKMKLENMPIPLTVDMIDEFMGSILIGAKTGDINIIKSIKSS